jgi:hypothetical protein
VVVVHRQADLLQVVGALHPVGRLPDLLHGRQEQPDQDRDDGDDHQELNERKASATEAGASRRMHGWTWERWIDECRRDSQRDMVGPAARERLRKWHSTMESRDDKTVIELFLSGVRVLALQSSIIDVIRIVSRTLTVTG